MKSTFRKIGVLEGTSLLTLLCIAMPLKYIWKQPEYVHVVGMIHGLLFLSYIMLAIVISTPEKWSRNKLILAMFLSTMPFGTFIFDYFYLAEKKA